MTLEAWFSLVLLCILGASTPGPSLAVILGQVLRGGRSPGLAAALAHGLAVTLYALLAVLGLAAVIASSSFIFSSLQLIAAAYLLYLGISALHDARAAPSEARAPLGSEASFKHPGLNESSHHYSPAGILKAAREGFLIAFLNPKLGIYMMALFTPFLHPEQGIGAQALIVLTIGGIDALWYVMVVVLVSRGRQVREFLDQYRPVIDRVYGMLLVALSILVAAQALTY